MYLPAGPKLCLKQNDTSLKRKKRIQVFIIKKFLRVFKPRNIYLFTPPSNDPAETLPRQDEKMTRARKMRFPAQLEFSALSPPCLRCFPVERFVSPSEVMQVPLQIIAKDFISPSRYFQSPLKMYSFIISPLYF